mgnify:CR=1 FL=1
MTQTLSQLENSGAFIERHIGPDAAQQQEMLNAVGAQSLNALTGQIVPKDIQLATPPQVGAPATEYAAGNAGFDRAGYGFGFSSG